MFQFDDSMIDLHMLSQIPLSCRCKQLLVCVTAPRMLTNFSPSHVMSLICTDEIESIEWQDLVPQQRTSDCLFIHIPRKNTVPSVMPLLQDVPDVNHEKYQRLRVFLRSRGSL